MQAFMANRAPSAGKIFNFFFEATIVKKEINNLCGTMNLSIGSIRIFSAFRLLRVFDEGSVAGLIFFANLVKKRATAHPPEAVSKRNNQISAYTI